MPAITRGDAATDVRLASSFPIVSEARLEIPDSRFQPLDPAVQGLGGRHVYAIGVNGVSMTRSSSPSPNAAAKSCAIGPRCRIAGSSHLYRHVLIGSRASSSSTAPDEDGRGRRPTGRRLRRIVSSIREYRSQRRNRRARATRPALPWCDRDPVVWLNAGRPRPHCPEHRKLVRPAL